MKNYGFLALALLALFSARAQVNQDFNKSLNQVGACWQFYQMKISAQNPINSGNQRRALAGDATEGDPAYYMQTPLLNFNGSGSIDFKHKLDVNDGSHRELQILLKDPSERLVQVVHSTIYVDSNGVNGLANPTQVQNTSIPINFSGDYYLQFYMISRGGTSVLRLDDLSINALDVSNADSANAHGYCREDDVIYDTICAGDRAQYSLPFPIPQSTWEWTWQGQVGGTVDSSLVTSAKDSLVEVQWSAQASGNYVLRATEVRPPYNARDYKVRFRVFVRPKPSSGPIYHY